MNLVPIFTVACLFGLSSALTITTTVCDPTAESVTLTGPWWHWDPFAGPVAVKNDDNTWTFTFEPAPTADIEYVLMVDGVPEDLVADNTASEDWSCTPITDFSSYTNRQWVVGSGDVVNTYGTCRNFCRLTITTTVCDPTAESVMLTGPSWGPASSPVAVNNGDNTWTFTFEPAPTADIEYVLMVDGVQENLVADNTASEDWSCTPITDFYSYTARQWVVGSGDVVNTYGTCRNFCRLTITTTVCDPTAESVTLTGPWYDWDPATGPDALNNGDNTWTFTFDVTHWTDTDNMEYLLVVDGVQENLVAANTASADWSSTPITDLYSYAHRQWVVGSEDVVNTYGGTCTAAEPIAITSFYQDLNNGCGGNSIPSVAACLMAAKAFGWGELVVDSVSLENWAPGCWLEDLSMFDMGVVLKYNTHPTAGGGCSILTKCACMAIRTCKQQEDYWLDAECACGGSAGEDEDEGSTNWCTVEKQRWKDAGCFTQSCG